MTSPHTEPAGDDPRIAAIADVLGSIPAELIQRRQTALEIIVAADLVDPLRQRVIDVWCGRRVAHPRHKHIRSRELVTCGGIAASDEPRIAGLPLDVPSSFGGQP